MRHLRRPMANRTECDPDDERETVDDPALATCRVCVEAFEHRRVEWFKELLDGPRPPQQNAHETKKES